ncbi:sigma-70 family RNA polymerase sigma factor [Novosphingobium aerophilum]|uniref:RNA polymerase subunit sigma-70 n=1 Tax=Novosphingobium TaxID=165696 RepID=UPI0006C8D573|nr:MULTISPECIES: RNA polymerase subunit sigma-70 [unclassified Novosphingobium]KPH62803.1 RNA polymerase subunit sigma-70 [Novosphingobium sp. ST904]MPS71233.1 sigma-70 family RNA polymerase sigma factor [Novosphingobium sp.]WRT92769.1 sigma-70 family RNA polymerase sigma factor [Novosphingobium sp. RL4]
MSKITVALEAAVATVRDNMPAEGEAQSPRQRVVVDRAFGRIIKLIAPRIRHFIRQYGLVAHWDDAEQVCAIAVHRAIQAYEPEKAQFTTFVNWQIRGELQSLRFRLMTDQRPSARKVEATTVSLDAISVGEDGEGQSIVASIEDEDALNRTEAGASDYLARSAMASLTESYVEHLRNIGIERIQRRAQPKKAVRAEAGTRRSVWRTGKAAIDPVELAELEERLEHNRKVVEGRLFDIATLDMIEDETGVAKERVRQIAKRAAKTMSDLAGADPRFLMMAEYRQSMVAPASAH